jgi:hypothetical protein
MMSAVLAAADGKPVDPEHRCACGSFKGRSDPMCQNCAPGAEYDAALAGYDASVEEDAAGTPEGEARDAWSAKRHKE